MPSSASGPHQGDGRSPWVGSRVQLAGTELAACHRPGRGPSIVLEAGLGLPGSIWTDVCDLLPRDRAVLRYDRAGLGDSCPGALPRSASRQARELAELLDRLGLPRPYVLVGHSAGALVVRLFAAEHPDDVARLVLVDPAHEHERIRAGVDLAANAALWILVLLARSPVLARTVRAVVRTTMPRVRPRVARRVRLLPVLLRPGHLDATRHENQAFASPVAEGRRVTIASPPVAARVITAFPVRGALWRTTHPWTARQPSAAALDGDPRRIRAEGSGHLVPLDAPELVASVISRPWPDVP